MLLRMQQQLAGWQQQQHRQLQEQQLQACLLQKMQHSKQR
jgi:hypothetical protein